MLQRIFAWLSALSSDFVLVFQSLLLQQQMALKFGRDPLPMPCLLLSQLCPPFQSLPWSKTSPSKACLAPSAVLSQA
jgi:hypothetical protein